MGVTARRGSATLSHVFRWDVLPLSLDTPTAPSLQQGAAASLALTAYSFNSPASYHFQAFGLPKGLTLNAASGLISGTLAPSASGDYAVRVAVSEGGVTQTRDFTWSVSDRVELETPEDQEGLEGDAVSLTVSATNSGTLALTYAASGLPAGLTLNASTGLISGTLAGARRWPGRCTASRCRPRTGRIPPRAISPGRSFMRATR